MRMPMIALLFMLLSAGVVHAEQVAQVASPDGRIAVQLDLDGDGRLAYRVQRDGRPVIADSHWPSCHSRSTGPPVASCRSIWPASQT